MNSKNFKIGLFGINADSGLSLTTYKNKWKANTAEIEKLIKFCDGKIDFILPLSKWKGWDGKSNPNGMSYETLSFAANCLAKTKKLFFFATVHVPFIHPVFATKSLCTISKFSQERIGLNIVCGWNQDELRMFRNEDLNYSDQNRYKYGEEWINIFKDLNSSKKPISFKSNFFNIKNAQTSPKINIKNFKIVSAAFSPEGRSFALKNCNILFTMFQNIKTSKIQNKELKNKNKKIEIFCPIHIICKNSDSEADEFHDFYSKQNQDTQATNNFILNVAKAKKNPLYKIMKQKSDIIASSCGSYIVKGSPKTVAEKLREIKKAGFSGAAFSFVNYFEDFQFFYKKVIQKKIFN